MHAGCSSHAWDVVCGLHDFHAWKFFSWSYYANIIGGFLGIFFYAKLNFGLYKKGTDGLKVGMVASESQVAAKRVLKDFS